jgi:hypothetical protein
MHNNVLYRPQCGDSLVCPRDNDPQGRAFLQLVVSSQNLAEPPFAGGWRDLRQKPEMPEIDADNWYVMGPASGPDHGTIPAKHDLNVGLGGLKCECVPRFQPGAQRLGKSHRPTVQ